LNASDLAVQIIEKPEGDSVITFLQITNRSDGLIGREWRLYFSLGLSPVAEERRVTQTILDGRYGFLEPSAEWQALEPGASINIQIENWLFSGMQLVARQGFHVTQLIDGSEHLLGSPVLLEPDLVPLTSPRNTWVSAATPQQDHKLVAPLESAPDEIIPAVKEQVLSSGEIHVTSLNVADTTLNSEAIYLRKLLLQMGVFGEGTPIYLSTDPSLGSTYELDTATDGINIVGQDEQAVFYGIQTLRQLIRLHEGGCTLPIVQVADAPDFEHRAFFLDIARHFQPLDQLKKTIEVMSTYKMNRLQLGISNDEGWRLEIQPVPELTIVGARRSYYRYNPDGTQRALYPAWGDDHHDYDGFISRNEFIDLLRHAKKHHVEVILEFNLPGHANAILQSLSQTDRWQLTDPEDKSEYRSAQGYTGNVINVGMIDNYRLAKVILEEIKAMYDAAEAPMSRIHFGGDEVPEGAWLHSPACRRLPVWNPGWDVENPEQAKEATQALMAYHYNQITAIAEQVSPDIQTGFWHEMSASGRGNTNSYYNAWLTSDANTDIIDSLLDRGQNLVISNASFLYLDMPYAMHPDEPGLPWAGYVNTQSIYNFDPLDCWGLAADQSSQVLGIQAQLWSETVFTPELMDYYTFPRLLAVAERAWNKRPVQDHWPRFRQALATRELPHIDRLGVKYRPADLED
jgi:hexosaminidase